VCAALAASVAATSPQRLHVQPAVPSFSSSTTSKAAGLQQAAEAPEQTGLLTQYKANLGSMLGSIAAMVMGPGPVGTVGNLCVAVNYTAYTQLDLYVGCREKQFKSHSLEKIQQHKYRTFAATPEVCPCHARQLLCQCCSTNTLNFTLVRGMCGCVLVCPK
jgi:hypothetical protein